MSRRTVCIVGASGNLGEAIASRLSEAGFGLALTARTGAPPPLPDAQFRSLDVRESPALARMVEELQSEHGPLYGLVYCAGVVHDAPVSVFSDRDWEETFAVNVQSAAVAIRAVSRGMMVNRGGRIVLIGSSAGRRAGPGQAAYASSKAALEALCRVTALELGRYGVTCNVVAPGAIESRMFRQVKEALVQRTIQATPLRRLGECRHVAAAVQYLLSEDADFVTGQTLVVDGGLSVA